MSLSENAASAKFDQSSSIAPALDKGGGPSFLSATGADTDIVFRLTSLRQQSRNICYEIHSTQFINALDIPYNPDPEPSAATCNLHLYCDTSVYADKFRKISLCLCLFWQARRYGAKACSAAIAFMNKKSLTQHKSMMNGLKRAPQ